MTFGKVLIDMKAQFKRELGLITASNHSKETETVPNESLLTETRPSLCQLPTEKGQRIEFIL